MEYISTKAAAEKWNVTQRRVVKLASEGRIPGASYIGSCWMIPENAPKPKDGRTKLSRATEDECPFRFPLFVNVTENGITPPLSEEELLLQKAQIDFYNCEFEKAYKSFSTLSEKAENRYVKICALFYLCILPAAYRDDESWERHYRLLYLSFEKDFPYKKEMELLLPWLNTLLGMYLTAAKEYRFDFGYNYHSSVNYLNANLSVLCRLRNGIENVDLADLEIYEILCQNMENDCHYFEAEELHLSLFTAGFFAADKNRMTLHLKKALQLAFEHHNLFSVANLFPYYQDIYNAVLKDFPKDFAEKIRKNGMEIDAAFTSFTRKYHITEIYSLFSKKDSQLMLYASYGYTYKQVAKIMNISERTVATKYSNLFEKMNVTNKNDLCLLLAQAWTKK